jgi:hypothetical protein
MEKRILINEENFPLSPIYSPLRISRRSVSQDQPYYLYQESPRYLREAQFKHELKNLDFGNKQDVKEIILSEFVDDLFSEFNHSRLVYLCGYHKIKIECTECATKKELIDKLYKFYTQ